MSAFELDRFVEAQDAGDTYAAALAEVRAGRKRSHWMWFVFPQLVGLGRSATARHFGITSIDEARAYLGHAVLGPRLREIAAAAAEVATGSADDVFGGIDAVKLRSSMTLFARAADDPHPFRSVLDRYFDGRPDPRTEELLDR